MGKTNTYMGIVVGVAGLLAASYAFKKRENIKENVKTDFFGFIDELKDKSALKIHNKVGYPVYEYMKQKENIPF